MEAGRRPNEGEAVWSVFSPTKGWLGDIRLPAGLRLLEIGQQHILAHDRDSLDTELVRVLHLRRG